MCSYVPAVNTYYGLRSYGTPPQIWGGNDGCQHEWSLTVIEPRHSDDGITGSTLEGSKTRQANAQRSAITHGFCQSCQAWRGELGQEPTLALYLDHLLMVFDAVRRVLRDDGTCFVNLGDSFCGGGGFFPDAPSNIAGSKQTKQRGAIKGGIRAGEGFKNKDLMLIPHRFAIAMQDRGWWVRNDLVWAKTACMPESVTDRATRSHEYIFHFAKSARYYYDADAVKEDLAEASFSRAQYARVGHAKDIYGDGITNLRNPKTDAESRQREIDNGKRNQRTVWTIGPEPLRDEHYAAWPTEIPRRCILAGSKPGDTVLDPFIGSGRTGIVSDRLGRDCIGIELSPVNVAMSERLIRGDAPLFANVEVA